MPQNEGVPLAKFLYVVGQLKFRGTSVLFRLPRSPVVKTTRSHTRVRELSPGPRSIPPERTRDPTSAAASEKSPKSEKRVSFTGVGRPEDSRAGDREKVEEKMDVNGDRDEVDGGGRKKEDEGMHLDPSESLPVNMAPPGRRGMEEEEEDVLGALSGLGGDEFSIATHFVKVGLCLCLTL